MLITTLFIVKTDECEIGSGLRDLILSQKICIVHLVEIHQYHMKLPFQGSQFASNYLKSAF